MEGKKQTLTQELSDLFYGLQISTKILEGISTEYDNGQRSQEDYEARFHSQVWLLSNNLKKIKPLVDEIIKIGFSKYGRSVGSDSAQVIQSEGSNDVFITEQVQTQES